MLGSTAALVAFITLSDRLRLHWFRDRLGVETTKGGATGNPQSFAALVWLIRSFTGPVSQSQLTVLLGSPQPAPYTASSGGWESLPLQMLAVLDGVGEDLRPIGVIALIGPQPSHDSSAFCLSVGHGG